MSFRNAVEIASKHWLEYARRSTKCKGTCHKAIEENALRYGTRIGKSYRWWHWQCVSSRTLKQLKICGLGPIPGFEHLSALDRARVQADVLAGHVMSPLAAFAPASNATSGDEDSDIDKAQDVVIEELYTKMRTEVVGLRYYKGMVGLNKHVRVEREPMNELDSNAVRVVNAAGVPLGYISRMAAARLAPLIDQGLISIKATHLAPKRVGWYTLLELSLYGPANRRTLLEPLLLFATPYQSGFTDEMRTAKYTGNPNHAYTAPISSQSKVDDSFFEAERLLNERIKKHELETMHQGLSTTDNDSLRAGVLDSLCDIGDVLELPELELTRVPSQLTIPLFRHQLQALRWCIEKEHPVLPSHETDPPVQFWVYKKDSDGDPFYYNIVKRVSVDSPPILGRGGLVADSMGLGKTLTMLALVLATKDEPRGDNSGATLIVCPISVLSTWEAQLSDHIEPGSLNLIVYYGAGRNTPSETLAAADVVLTSYSVVTRDPQNKDEGGLAGVKWKRIILDEGHMIRNSKTKVAKAVRGLEAERRWVVTGTPIINSPKDVGSILRFLRVCPPLDLDGVFERLIAIDQLGGGRLLKDVMNQICLRRTKEMQTEDGKHLVDLPPVSVLTVNVTLPPDVRTLYDDVEALSRNRFRDFMKLADQQPRCFSENFIAASDVLGMLTRLRQLVLHPDLIPRDYVKVLQEDQISESAAQVARAQITAEKKVRLQARLARAIEENEECPICYEVVRDPRITVCSHVFCLECITKAINDNAACPVDGQTLGMQDLVEPAPPSDTSQYLDSEDEDAALDYIGTGSSAKIMQLIKLLKLTPSGDKSLVFSQFTSFLDKIGDALRSAGIPYMRLDGQMTAKKRDEVIRVFSIPLRDNVNPINAPNENSISNNIDVENSDEDDEYLHVKNDEALIGDDRNLISGDTSSKGKGEARTRGRVKSGRRLRNELSKGVNPPVLLISLKAGALGLNLTVANNVYLMDPWWQAEIESQAIDRCNRIGQTKPVRVFQLVAEDTVEERVLAIQERKKDLIKQAFSGIKSRETERTKRLNDLKEIFGIEDEIMGL